MKNAQNDFEKAPEKSHPNTSTTSTTTSETLVNTQSAQLQPTSSINPIGISEIAENVHNNNATAASAEAATASHATKMTDKDNNENNNDKSSSSSSSVVNNNNNNCDRGNIIAEAAKILIKNGLNGTSAAALLAAQSFQLPTFSLASIASTTTTPECYTLPEPPPAHVANTTKISESTTTTMSSTHIHSYLSSTSRLKDAYNVVTSSSGVNRTSLDTGVIDCSLNNSSATTNGPQKLPLITGTGNGSGGHSHGGGGRLQFFKDGRFILELARSKDGERGGWVSVPRKQFRTPSTTSSTVAPVSTTNANIYPKIESSTSFSFSDDNSSIQSSPWQRDHCWKQSTPRRNISREMSLYYHLPSGVKLSNEGIRLAKSKRRRPYDSAKLDPKTIYSFIKNNKGGGISSGQEIENGKHVQTETTKSTDEEEDRLSTSSVATLIDENEVDSIKNKTIDENTTPTTKTTLACSNSNTEFKSKIADNDNGKNAENDCKMEDTMCSSNDEKMNTSEDGENEAALQEEVESKPSVTTNVKTASESQLDLSPQRAVTPTPVKSKTGVEDKRLIKKKIVRAKLSTIVQKLIDRMPKRASKTPFHNNVLSNKVSPTSSSSTSPSLVSSSSSSALASSAAAVNTASHRLVEYHQQHVSPRKRILRELEKVSLDDNATVTGAGGKRSRAKNCATTNANYRNSRSPNQRVHSSVCNVPVASSLSAAAAATTSSSPSTSNGDSQFSSCGSAPAVKVNKNYTTTSVGTTTATSSSSAPTRLYSSYSIHSLLGDNGNSKKSTDNMTAGFHSSISPKSPESSCGKSPSNAAHKKRSPPYASPLREARSRSPSVMNNLEYSPRGTPTTFKQHYDSPGLAEHQSHLLQQHHRPPMQQQGAFYPPYAAMSSKYVSSGARSIPEHFLPTSSPRASRHSIASLTSCQTTLTTTTDTYTTTSTHSIPSSSSPMSHHSKSSPSRSLADTSREPTTRTVPKKTASIRREFASPTSMSSGHSSSQHSTSNKSSSSISPGLSAEECSQMDFNVNNPAAAAAAAAAYQQLMQRQTSGSLASSLSSPLHHAAAYYMYPSAATLPPSGGAPATASHATPTSPYIPTLMPPSYYHSYISALNITKHYYMGAGASPQSAAAAAAARLSPPFHHLGIPYNGVSAAALTAAAAAAFTGQPPGHLTHHSMLPPPSAAAAALYGAGGLGSLGSLTSMMSPTTANSSSANSTTHKLSSERNLAAFNENSMLNNSTSSGATTTVAATASATQTATITSKRSNSQNIQDEQSSDVPLNLSKH